ncbi:hypothetical protein SAMN04488072_101505 [Lentibacillus halodurans]|uniref:Uncharacterized protein n=1 Tax=Lentibacillus halodurans TaxID=237679 RepID=A0A1I0VLN0_9BACI|nr:hypothetical protein [Lentibacillus halodurans]SFA77201.1 hypothetical protein SAMN04488072_101505 [Lentibacillus halodurans]
MGWKSIEMQVALPRTQDAGKLQDQMSKQNQHFQASLAQSQLKEAEQKRNRVQEFEKIQDVNENARDHHRHSLDDQKGESDGEQDEFDIEHPYLGKKIDFSG